MSQHVTIYHNPDCIKSREALDQIRSHGIEPEVINYLETPPSVDDLKRLKKLLGVAPSSMIRAADFDRLGLERTADIEQLYQLINKNPVILHRPIVVVGESARIARPASLVDEMLS